MQESSLQTELKAPIQIQSVHESQNIEVEAENQNEGTVEYGCGSEKSLLKDQQKYPFLIEVFTKDDREKEKSNRPKLGLRRLTDDRKIVPIDIDIPMDDIILKEKFDWDLSKEKISPAEFSKELVGSLNLEQSFVEKIRDQILRQIMEHIKKNTRQKPPEQIQQPPAEDHSIPFSRNFQAIRFNNNDYPEDDIEREENQKKKMSRMRRKELQRTNIMNASQPNRYFKEKKICRNCKHENVTPGFQCRVCKFPFELMEMLNMDDKRVKISVKYYEKIANKIPLLVYEAKKRHFEKEDFDSFYYTYNKIRSIFETCDQLSRESLNQVKYIMEKYHEYFLNGQLDFNDDEIIYEKESKKDLADSENRPKRQRGRPRKIKIIHEDSLPGSANSDSSDSEDSDGSEESSEFSDSE